MPKLKLRFAGHGLGTIDMRAIDAPYIADPKDPAYIPINRENSIKVLTINPRRRIIKLVKRAKTKGRQMATDKKPTLITDPRLITAGWLVFAVQQTFVGMLVWRDANTVLALMAAVVSIIVAGAVVIVHFLRAHQS